MESLMVKTPPTTSEVAPKQPYLRSLCIVLEGVNQDQQAHIASPYPSCRIGSKGWFIQEEGLQWAIRPYSQ